MTVSTSPLCLHIEEYGAVEDWLRSLQVLPVSVLAFDAGVCRAVKSLDPGIVTFYRRYIPDQGSYMREGAAGGARFVAECGDLSGVDYLTGLNESTGDDALSIEQTCDFFVGFAQACAGRGVRPAGPNVAVGNPPDEYTHLLQPAVDAILAANGLVTYHSYGPRTLHTSYEWLLHRAPDRWPLFGVTVPAYCWAYTEAGWDDVGDPGGEPSGPWRELVRRGLLTPQSMCAQLDTYAETCAMRGVRYVHLFTFGGSEDWRDYDFMAAPDVRQWLAAHWAEHTAPPPPPPPPVVSSHVRVTALAANLRTEPRIDPANITGRAVSGSILPVEAHEGEWYRIRERLYIHESTVAPM